MSLTWNTMLLITKVGGEYIGVGLVEFIWKVYESIMNKMLQSSITLHNALHGFRQGREMGTATMEVNLAQQLAGLCHEPISRFFWMSVNLTAHWTQKVSWKY